MIEVVHFGNTEVDDLGDDSTALGAQEDIVRFEIAMDDACCVGRDDAGQHWDHQVGDFRYRQSATAAQVAPEVLAIQEFHHQIGTCFVMHSDIEHFDHVGVVQARGGFSFSCEAPGNRGAPRVVALQHLDRHPLSERLVLRQIHDGHAPAANGPRDPVGTQGRSGGE